MERTDPQNLNLETGNNFILQIQISKGYNKQPAGPASFSEENLSGSVCLADLRVIDTSSRSLFRSGLAEREATTTLENCHVTLRLDSGSVNLQYFVRRIIEKRYAVMKGAAI